MIRIITAATVSHYALCYNRFFICFIFIIFIGGGGAHSSFANAEISGGSLVLLENMRKNALECNKTINKNAEYQCLILLLGSR